MSEKLLDRFTEHSISFGAKVRCFFGWHEYWSNNKCVSLFNGSKQAYVPLYCCINCGRFRANISTVFIWDEFERWQEMAGVDNKTTIPDPDPKLVELKNLVDAGSALDLSKMDIDVESYEHGEELAKKKFKELGYKYPGEDKDESANGS